MLSHFRWYRAVRGGVWHLCAYRAYDGEYLNWRREPDRHEIIIKTEEYPEP